MTDRPLVDIARDLVQQTRDRMTQEQRAAEEQKIREANVARIDYLRGEFTTNLAETAAALTTARATLGQLCAPDVYDVEYADGGADDLEHCLDHAARMLRTAQALHTLTVSGWPTNA